MLNRLLPVTLVITVLATTACAGRGRADRERDEFFPHTLAQQRHSRDSLARAIRDSLNRELLRREAQWAAHHITAYRLAVRVTCYCPARPLAVVTVRGDSTDVRNALGQPLTKLDTPWLTFTVPRLFDELRRAVSDTGRLVRARFDSTYGFVDVLSIGHRGHTHDGYHAHVEAFEVLPPTPPSSRMRQN